MRTGSVVPFVALLAEIACAEPAAPVGQLVAPLCVDPAPLLGSADPRAPGYIVVFHDSLDARVETARLAARYDFVPSHVYEFALRGFSAQLSTPVVAEVRCEASVSYVEHDGVVAATP